MESVSEIIKDPEHFLLEKYYGLKVPNGFRIELFCSRKLKLIYEKTIHGLTYYKTEDFWLGKKMMKNLLPVKKLSEIISKKTLARHHKKVFCPYCEKLVVPRRTHKLDYADLTLFLFTAGFWAIMVLSMYIFIRKCPVCNYNLRGFKPLSKKNGQ